MFIYVRIYFSRFVCPYVVTFVVVIVNRIYAKHNGNGGVAGVMLAIVMVEREKGFLSPLLARKQSQLTQADKEGNSPAGRKERQRGGSERKSWRNELLGNERIQPSY